MISKSCGLTYLPLDVQGVSDLLRPRRVHHHHAIHEQHVARLARLHHLQLTSNIIIRKPGDETISRLISGGPLC